jgi:hypothetical protein
MNLIVVDQMVAGWLYQMTLSPLFVLNITVLQEGIESQAVDRVNRIGQKKAVHVYQLIAENTVESKVLDIQEKKKQLIKQVSPFRT